MWQTLLLYQENPVFAWLPIETIIAQKQSEYYRSIRRSTQKNDSGIFTQFMLAAIKEATGDFKERHQKTITKDAGINAGINAGIKLSKTQEKILTIIAQNNRISQSEIAGLINISGSTVYRNIEKLKQLKMLERRGAKKDGIWITTMKKERPKRSR